jgi:hypothetical protein
MKMNLLLLSLAFFLLPETAAAPQPLYDKVGAIDVGTFENTMVYWHGALLVLENIPCSYKGHAGETDASYGNHSYARLKDFATGAVLANISSTRGFGFISAFPDYAHDTLWLFGTPADRCDGNGAPTTVQSWWTNDPALQQWSTALAFDLGKATHNVQVTSIGPRGGAGAAERAAWSARRGARSSGSRAFAPSARYAMFLECFVFLVNDAADGNLTRGWSVVESTAPPGGACGGPSFTYSPEDDHFYILTGGRTVQLFRTLNFSAWAESSPSPFIAPSPEDGLVAPFAGFPAVAATEKGSPPQAHVNVPEPFPFVPFDPVWTANWSSWALNSNDADVCCQHANVSDAWLIYGTSTQGRPPKAPLDGTDAGTNSVAVQRGVSINQLLAAYFP